MSELKASEASFQLASNTGNTGIPGIREYPLSNTTWFELYLARQGQISGSFGQKKPAFPASPDTLVPSIPGIPVFPVFPCIPLVVYLWSSLIAFGGEATLLWNTREYREYTEYTGNTGNTGNKARRAVLLVIRPVGPFYW